MGHSAEYCRSCGDLKLCDEWTLHTKDVVIHDEGFSDQDGESISGLCDECLKEYGPDDECVVPDEDNRTGVDD